MCEVIGVQNGRIAVLVPMAYDILDREFLAGIAETAQRTGFDTLVFTAVSTNADKPYTDGENNIYDLPLSADIDGVIIATSRFKDKQLAGRIYNKYKSAGVPCVSIDENSRELEEIYSMQSESIFEITEHLITAHSYKNILCLTGSESSKEATERARGYVKAMKKYGLSNSEVIYGDFWYNSAAELAKELAGGKRERPEAIVCTNDIMAVGLCNSFRKEKIRVPEDIAVTGYDGSIYAMVSRPAVTTVCSGEKSLGMLSAKKLFEKLGVVCDCDCNRQHIRFCESCGCKDDDKEKEQLLEYTKTLIHRQLNRKSFMYSNYIAKMSDCESIPKFASVLDSLRYMLPECRKINVCVCEDWRVENPQYRKSGFSDTMQLIYSEDQPGQLDFPISRLLPCLNNTHSPQFWVFGSLHYSDRILGYIATQYEKAEQFSADEHYIGWCDAVANGLDIVIKKSNTEYIWQKLEEKNMTDLYTGLLSRRGFVAKLTNDDCVMLLSFPSRYAETPYFVPIVSAVLRSHEESRDAIYLGETVFGVRLAAKSCEGFPNRLLKYLSELGIYAVASELNVTSGVITDADNADDMLTALHSALAEKTSPKKNEAYSELFSSLRNEMKYSPQSNWSVAEAALRTGLSASHFQRLYKKHFGVPFTEELIAFRMERARYLLKNSDMSIQRIAEECGYTSPAHFMRQFRERENMSAGQYRRS